MRPALSKPTGLRAHEKRDPTSSELLRTLCWDLLAPAASADTG